MTNYGQSKRFLTQPDKNHSALKVSIESETSSNIGLEPNAYVSDRGADIVFGESIYDVQTNSTIPRQIDIFPDGTMGAVWCRGFTTAGNYPDRGTGINHFDGAWGPLPDARIEAQRVGWPNYSSYGENGEIVCTHSGGNDGLIFSWRENKGTGSWNYFDLVGPAGHEDILWPRMVVSGENNDIIHVIAITPPTSSQGTIYEGLNGAMLYSRSMDGGVTWDPENAILEGLDSEYFKYNTADNYAWAFPKNGVIAFVINHGVNDGVIMKSDDQGDSWEKITFFNSPYPMQDGNLPFDAYYGPDGCTDLLIDDEGKMHVSFGRTYYSWNDGIYYNFGVDGLIYWNEDKPVLDSTIMGDPDALEAAGCLAAWVIEGPSPGDTIMNLTGYGSGMTSSPQMAFHRDNNNIPIVTIFYTSYDWERNFDPTNENKTYRSIWKVTTEDNGVSWSNFENLTGDVFHKFSECIYPSLASELYNNTYHMVYESDGIPGRSASTSPDHDPTLNSSVYLPYSPLAVDVADVKLQEVNISQNYPNPFNGKTYIDVVLSQAANVTLDVYTLTGQKVSMTEFGVLLTGTHNIPIDANQLSTGVYFYTITAGESKVTRKMMVE